MAHTGVAVRQQLITACMVAGVVSLFEAVLFFRVLTPEVNGKLRGMLDSAAPPPPPGVAGDMASAALAIAEERERQGLHAAEREAMVHAALIVALPLAVAALTWATSEPLRRAPVRPMLVDCATVIGGIGLFEGLFYVLGHRWQYLGDAELRMVVATRYLQHQGSAKVAVAGREAEHVV